MASIQRIVSPLTKEISYHAQVRVKGRSSESVTFPYRKEAEARAASIETAIREGRHFPHAAAKRTRFDALAKDYADPQTIVVRFNPWHFGSEERLLKGFFATLADALRRSLSTRKEEIGEVLKEYGSVLSVASIDIGHGARLSAGSVATSIGEALSAVELE